MPGMICINLLIIFLSISRSSQVFFGSLGDAFKCSEDNRATNIIYDYGYTNDNS